MRDIDKYGVHKEKLQGICDEITVLNFGTVLAQGTAKEALSDPDVIKAYIGN